MTTAHAFGLELVLHGGLRVPGLIPSQSTTPDEATHVRCVDRAAVDALWADTEPTRVRELRHRGELLMTIDHDVRAGHLVETPFHGRFLVSADGREVLCGALSSAGTRWHGLLLGQVLPIAATVRGLEVFHAGAVAVDGGVALVCASSGIGKSTLVAHIVARGGALVADDAVAVSVADGVALAHPGPPLLHLVGDAAPELRLGSLAVVDGPWSKRTLLAPSSGGPLPIRALYLLERGEPGTGPRILTDSVLPAELLGSTLTRAVQTPERLVRHLDVCATLASTVEIRRLRMGGPAAPAAEALLGDLGVEPACPVTAR